MDINFSQFSPEFKEKYMAATNESSDGGKIITKKELEGFSKEDQQKLIMLITGNKDAAMGVKFADDVDLKVYQNQDGESTQTIIKYHGSQDKTSGLLDLTPDTLERYPNASFAYLNNGVATLYDKNGNPIKDEDGNYVTFNFNKQPEETRTTFAQWYLEHNGGKFDRNTLLEYDKLDQRMRELENSDEDIFQMMREIELAELKNVSEDEKKSFFERLDAKAEYKKLEAEQMLKQAKEMFYEAKESGSLGEKAETFINVLMTYCQVGDNALGVTKFKEFVKGVSGLNALADGMTKAADDGDDSDLSFTENLVENIKGAGRGIDSFIGCQGAAFAVSLAAAGKAAAVAGVGEAFSLMVHAYFGYEGAILAGEGIQEAVNAQTKEQAGQAGEKLGMAGIMLVGTGKAMKSSVRNSQIGRLINSYSEVEPNILIKTYAETFDPIQKSAIKQSLKEKGYTVVDQPVSQGKYVGSEPRIYSPDGKPVEASRNIEQMIEEHRSRLNNGDTKIAKEIEQELRARGLEPGADGYFKMSETETIKVGEEKVEAKVSEGPDGKKNYDFSESTNNEPVMRSVHENLSKLRSGDYMEYDVKYECDIDKLPMVEIEGKQIDVANYASQIENMVGNKKNCTIIIDSEGNLAFWDRKEWIPEHHLIIYQSWGKYYIEDGTITNIKIIENRNINEPNGFGFRRRGNAAEEPQPVREAETAEEPNGFGFRRRGNAAEEPQPVRETENNNAGAEVKENVKEAAKVEEPTANNVETPRTEAQIELEIKNINEALANSQGIEARGTTAERLLRSYKDAIENGFRNDEEAFAKCISQSEFPQTREIYNLMYDLKEGKISGVDAVKRLEAMVADAESIKNARMRLAELNEELETVRGGNVNAHPKAEQSAQQTDNAPEPIKNTEHAPAETVEAKNLRNNVPESQNVKASVDAEIRAAENTQSYNNKNAVKPQQRTEAEIFSEFSKNQAELDSNIDLNASLRSLQKLIRNNPDDVEIISKIFKNRVGDSASIERLNQILERYPEYKSDILNILENNNIRFEPALPGYRTRNDINDIVSGYLMGYPGRKDNIVEYLKVQRFANNDTRDFTSDISRFIDILDKYPQQENVIMQLCKNPNLNAQKGIEQALMLQNKYPIEDILKLSDRKHNVEGMHLLLETCDSDPALKQIIFRDEPKYKFIDKTPDKTPENIILKRDNTKTKLEAEFKSEMEELNKTLGDDFYYKIQWEEIIPKNASPKEIKDILTYLNKISKFFARTAHNENEYGKNIQWADAMYRISEINSYYMQHGVSDIETIYYSLGKLYNQYDIRTTLEFDGEYIGSGHRRLSSGHYRRYDKPDGYFITPNDNYIEYVERLKGMLYKKRILSPYGIELTKIKMVKGEPTMFHPENATVEKGMKLIQGKYDSINKYIQKVQNGEKLSEKQIQEVHGLVAELYFISANVMPFARGSNGISDIFMRCIYDNLGIDQPALKRGVSLDLEAFCMDINEYKQRWLSFFVD